MEQNIKYDVFISYSSKDKVVADAICHILEQYGIPCWIAPRDVRPGERYALEIIHGIKSCRLMVLVFTSSSNVSQHVANEVDRAFNEEKTIIPFLVDETPMNEEFSYYLARKHWLVAYPHYAEKLDNLVQAVANNLGVELISVIDNRDNAQLIQQQKDVGGVQVHIEVDADCNMFSFSSYMQLLKAGEDNVVCLKPGNYKFVFASVKFPEVKVTIKHEVTQSTTCDNIEVKLKKAVEEEIARREEEASYPERLKRLKNKTLHLIKKDEKYGFADELGNVVIPCKWNKSFSLFHEDVVGVMDINGNWGFIDKAGKLVVPCQWKEVLAFYEGLAAVKNDYGEWGYIDQANNVVIPFQWKSASIFMEGLAHVKDINNHYGYIDKTGTIIIPCKWKYANSFSEGLAAVQDTSNKYGFIDKAGKVVIPCQWKYVSQGFQDGIAKVCDSKPKTWLINKTGIVVGDLNGLF